MTAAPYDPVPPARLNGHQFRPVALPPAAPVEIDYSVVRQLHGRVTDKLSHLLTDSANLTPAYRREMAERLGKEVIADYAVGMAHAGRPVSPEQERALLDALVAGMFGAGRLQKLLDDPGITNVHIIGCDQVLLHHADGTRSRGEPVADSDDELISMLQVLAMRVAATERQLSESNPEL